MRDHLFDNLEGIHLDNRAALARAFAPTFTPEELARLARSKVSVPVRYAEAPDPRFPR